MTRSQLTVFTLALAVFAVTGCTQWKSASIFKEDGAQLALTLNKNGTVTVVSPTTGERVQPCKLPNADVASTQDTGKAANISDAALASCYPKGHMPGKILFQKTYTVTVRKGTICMDIGDGVGVYVICNPPDPIEWFQ